MNMFEESSKKRIIFNSILGIVVLIWSFYFIDRGFYMDESGLLSLYRMHYQGDKMFVDIWDTLQMGGIFTYPLFALYYEVLQPFIAPIGCGVVLYMRIVYQIVRLAIAIYLYFTIRKTRYSDNAFITALVYYAFIISFKNFSYKSICDFGIILFLCWAYRYFDTEKKIYMVLMGLATCITIVAYPTMIMFPVFFVILLVVMVLKGYDIRKDILIYSITCFICGALFLIYLQITAGLPDVFMSLQYLSDESHIGGWAAKLGKMLLSYLLFAGIAYLPIVVMMIIERTRHLDDRVIHTVLSVYWIAFMVAIVALRPSSVSLSRFVYGLLIIFMWFPYLVFKKEKKEYTTIGQYGQADYFSKQILFIIFLVSVCVQAIWAFSTNLDIAIPGYMSIYVVLALIMIIGEEFEGLKPLRVAVVCFSLFFLGIWVAEGDGGYSDIFESRTYATYGAYQGIALSDFDYQMNESCYNLVNEYVTGDDLLYVPMGFSVSAYLNTDAREAVGTPYARAGKDQKRVLQYWEVYPEKAPAYILIDTANKYYEDFEQGETYKYIQENYPTTIATDGNFVLLSK